MFIDSKKIRKSKNKFNHLGFYQAATQINSNVLNTHLNFIEILEIYCGIIGKIVILKPYKPFYFFMDNKTNIYDRLFWLIPFANINIQIFKIENTFGKVDMAVFQYFYQSQGKYLNTNIFGILWGFFIFTFVFVCIFCIFRNKSTTQHPHTIFVVVV